MTMHRTCYNNSLLLSPVVENTTYSSPEKKRVAFYAEAETIPLQSPLDKLDSAEECANLFYKVTDLRSFREEAREISRQMRKQYNLDQAENCTSESGNGTMVVSPLMSQDQHTRGLEQRTCLERQKRRYFGIRLIVRASQSNKFHPDQLALYAHKCTHWATQLAAKEAVNDFLGAWFDSSPYSSSSVTAEASESTSIEKPKKRPLSSSSSVCGSVEAQRRVQRRLPLDIPIGS